MAKMNRYVVAAGAFTAALSIGYVMQKTVETPHSQPARTAAASQIIDEDGAVITLSDMALTSALPAAPMVARMPATLPDLPLINVAATESALDEFPREETAPGFACDVDMQAEAAAAAMVKLTLTSSCQAGERVTLHHSGMMITEVMDETGRLSITLPALSKNAVYIASFAIGDGAVASTEVPSLSLYERVVVQWKGQGGMQVHAFEFGADYGDDGHVSAETARDLTELAKGDGGVLTRHGDATLGETYLAEVYTFPVAATDRSGDVRLSAEAEVTAQNCGRDLEAQSLQYSPGRPLRVRDITLAMPDCDAIGDFLVLKNLLDDLKIASN